MRLLTITLNPAIDMALSVPQLEWNETHVASEARRAPGGKGINMARVAALYGEQATALFPAGGASGRFLIEALEHEGIDIAPVSILEENRTNIVVHGAPKQIGRARSLKVNSPGPSLRSGEWGKILQQIEALLPTHDAVALAGSFPSGLEDRQMQELFALLHRSEAPLLIDIPRGDYSEIAARGQPLLLKPNKEELANSLGRKLDRLDDLVEVGRGIVNNGARYFAITDGPRQALLFGPDEAVWIATPAPVNARSVAGMGDTFGVTLFLKLLEGGSTTDAFSRAMAAGAAAASSRETALMTTDQIDLCERAIEVAVIL